MVTTMQKKSPNKFADLLCTPLLPEHEKLNAKIVDFGGWALPVNYGSQIDEHHAVRKDVGMFDVSHMTVSDITGSETISFLKKVLANDIKKVCHQQGKALYSCMLNDQGGVIDDLIVYYLNDAHCRLVTNAGTNKKDMAWLQQQASSFDVTFTEKPAQSLIAIQGPNAIAKVKSTLPELTELLTSLKRFQGGYLDDSDVDNLFVGRTGYTGEDGIEMILPATQAPTVWQRLVEANIQPCGLGARDTLRLEAGMSLYGNDLDEQHTPLESGLNWTVSLTDDRDFIGKSALLIPAKHQMIGLRLEGKGVLRSHQAIIIDDNEVGEVTSGTFSPTLEKSIGIARISSDCNVAIGDTVNIQVRKKRLTATVVKYPFLPKS